MRAAALAALVLLPGGDTPEKTFDALVQAVRAMDWGAIYDLSAPSEHAQMSDQIDRLRKDPAGMERLVGLIGKPADQVRGMSTRTLVVAVMRKVAETNRESFEKELGRLRDAEITGKKVDGDYCVVTFRAAGTGDELELLRENGKWYYSTITKSKRASNERTASAGLKTLATAQADFRANDRDGDGAHNFWVRDVAGLYGIEAGGAPLKLIDVSIARADRSPARAAYAAVRDGAPKSGYVFVALAKYSEKGEARKYDEGGGRSASRFGFAAVPAEYGRFSRRTFLLGENHLLWAKDTRGRVPEVFPEDPKKEGWTNPY